MNCKKCNKLILEPGITYGINPNAICKCDTPQVMTDKTHKIVINGVPRDYTIEDIGGADKTIEEQVHNIFERNTLGEELDADTTEQEIVDLISQSNKKAYEKGWNDLDDIITTKVIATSKLSKELRLKGDK